MADVKEKLAELIAKAKRSMWGKSGLSSELAKNMYLAENLIANGVTVQVWISVKDKLPQNFVSVLGYMTDAGEFPPVRECYTVGNAFFFPALGDVHPVSHWCEMPQPPKGE